MGCSKGGNGQGRPGDSWWPCVGHWGRPHRPLRPTRSRLQTSSEALAVRASCLACPDEQSMRRAEIVILTGPSRAGKTTVCRRVVGLARRRGLSVAGVLTEDDRGPGGVTLQIVRDLLSDDEHVLASARGDHSNDTTQPSGEGTSGPSAASHLRWEFDSGGLAFGWRALCAAARLGCDLLVVDQIGPLELRDRQGWTGVHDILRTERYDLALVVVNPDFVDCPWPNSATRVRSCVLMIRRGMNCRRP